MEKFKKAAFIFAFIYILQFCFVSGVWAAEKRFALVIGNSAYENEPLTTPINDAGAMDSVLRSLGFSVTIVKDADRNVLRRSLDDFYGQIQPGDTVLLYYSGRALQYEGKNYLLPLGMKIENASDLAQGGIALNGIMESLAGRSPGVSIVLLDANRADPVAENFPDIQPGLAEVRAGGTMIFGMAAEPGKVVRDDSKMQYSDFTGNLIQVIRIPGAPLDLLFRYIQLKISRDSRGKQQPWFAADVPGEFQFVPGDERALEYNRKHQVDSSGRGSTEDYPGLAANRHGSGSGSSGSSRKNGGYTPSFSPKSSGEYGPKSTPRRHSNITKNRILNKGTVKESTNVAIGKGPMAAEPSPPVTAETPPTGDETGPKAMSESAEMAEARRKAEERAMAAAKARAKEHAMARAKAAAEAKAKAEAESKAMAETSPVGEAMPEATEGPPVPEAMPDVSAPPPPEPGEGGVPGGAPVMPLYPGISSSPGLDSTLPPSPPPPPVVAAAQPPVPEETSDQGVEKYPTMECPDEVPVGSEFAVQVSLTDDLITPDVKVKSGKTTEEGKLVLELPQDRDSWNIRVILSAPGLKFTNGSNIGQIELPRDGDSAPAIFFLKAEKPGVPGKPFNVYATFWHDGAFLAKVAKSITVSGGAEAPKMEKKKPAAPIASTAKAESAEPAKPAEKSVVLKGRPVQAAAARLSLAATTPDLTLYVLEGLNPADPKQTQIIIASPHLPPIVEMHDVQAELPLWLKLQYDKLVKRSKGLQTARTRGGSAKNAQTRAEAALRGFGRELYRKTAPEVFKKAFWKLHDKLGPDFRTIQIYSNNPVLPWELMKPTRSDGEEELDFLGLDFQVGRWHINRISPQLEKPPQKLPMRELIVIAPEYKGDMELPGIAKEVGALREVQGFRKITGRFEELEALLTNLPAGIVHFSGHGQVQPSKQGPSLYVIGLEDGYMDLMTWRGLITYHQKGPHPFFFFNACKVGQAHEIAGFVDGWAPAMLEAGASGFIGSLWPVDDEGAVRFSTAFYQALNHDLTGGSAVLSRIFNQTRKKLYKETGNPTYMAYVYYGDPNLEMVR